jgi:hypothetical protein
MHASAPAVGASTGGGGAVFCFSSFFFLLSSFFLSLSKSGWGRYHTDLSALAGHDGYGDPGADDVGHYLHHKVRRAVMAPRPSLCRTHSALRAVAHADVSPGVGRPQHFECNYGFSFPNYLDRMFGTFEDGSKWDKRAKAPAADDDAKSK